MEGEVTVDGNLNSEVRGPRALADSNCYTVTTPGPRSFNYLQMRLARCTATHCNTACTFSDSEQQVPTGANTKLTAQSHPRIYIDITAS